MSDMTYALAAATSAYHGIADSVRTDIVSRSREQVVAALVDELMRLDHDTVVGLAVAALMERAES